MSLTAPCKNCEERKIGCHSRCERYLEFAKERKHLLLQRYKENELTRVCLSQKSKNYFKSIRNKEYK